MQNDNNNKAFGIFEFIGAILRLPLFIGIVILKIFIEFPFEIILKIFGSVFLILGSIFGIIKSFFLSDRDEFKESASSIKESFELFAEIDALNLSASINFLKYGKYK